VRKRPQISRAIRRIQAFEPIAESRRMKEQGPKLCLLRLTLNKQLGTIYCSQQTSLIRSFARSERCFKTESYSQPVRPSTDLPLNSLHCILHCVFPLALDRPPFLSALSHPERVSSESRIPSNPKVVGREIDLQHSTAYPQRHKV